MIRLKPIYAVQRKIGKSKNWELTSWGKETLASCQYGIKDAITHYPDGVYRIIKINRAYELVKS